MAHHWSAHSIYERPCKKGQVIGELRVADGGAQPPDTFARILMKYYSGDLGLLLMKMSSGGYEARDIDVLEDLGLIYDSFRCDVQRGEQKFFRMKHNRWREVERITPFAEFGSFLNDNERLLRIITNKIYPRFSGGIWDGSSAERLLKDAIDPATVAKGKYYINAPESCDICSIPLDGETFISDGCLQGDLVWANMCADCCIYHGSGIGWGVGQLYRKESDGRWLMVGGSSAQEDEESD